MHRVGGMTSKTVCLYDLVGRIWYQVLNIKPLFISLTVRDVSSVLRIVHS